VHQGEGLVSRQIVQSELSIRSDTVKVAALNRLEGVRDGKLEVVEVEFAVKLITLASAKWEFGMWRNSLGLVSSLCSMAMNS
jgi:hypothetical protein